MLAWSRGRLGGETGCTEKAFVLVRDEGVLPRVTTLLPHNAPHDALVACHGADPAQPTEEFLFSRAAREGTPWTDPLNARTIRALSDADPLAGACLRHRLWYGRIIAREGGQVKRKTCWEGGARVPSEFLK